MYDEDLAPCPFCESEEAAFQGGRVVFVACDECGAKGPYELVPFDADEATVMGLCKAVVKGWNHSRKTKEKQDDDHSN